MTYREIMEMVESLIYIRDGLEFREDKDTMARAINLIEHNIDVLAESSGSVENSLGIDALPTIEERKTGRWIHYDDGSVSWRCSECGRHAYGVYAEVFSGEYHYCPNCGAMMGVEHD